MISYERKQKILKMLEGKDVIQISDICSAMEGISESTIRRDLKSLESEDQIVLLGGGGVRLTQRSWDAPMDSKVTKHADEKEKIAQYAASLVNPGEAIYIDAGSTTLRMFKHLKGKHVTVVTTSALAASELQKYKLTESDLHCIVIGGDVLVTTASFVGTVTNTLLSDYFYDKAFVGTSGISAMNGFNTPDMREAEKKRMVIAHSKKSYILADSSKYNVTAMCKFCDLGAVTLLCDRENELIVNAGNYIVV